MFPVDAPFCEKLWVLKKICLPRGTFTGFNLLAMVAEKLDVLGQIERWEMMRTRHSDRKNLKM